MAKTRETDLHGWMMILASTLGVAVCVIPVTILSLGVFMVPLGEAFAFGRGEISLFLTILSIAMAVALPFAGKLIDAYGVKLPMIASFAFYGLGVAAIPYAIEAFGLTGFYIIALWLGVAGAPSSTVAFVKVLSGWFDKSRGLAMGFAMSGIALGGAISPIYAATMIEGFGWQSGFYGLALLPLVIGIGATFALREPPHLSASADRAGISGLTQAEALKTPVFWMLLFLFLVAATAIHGIQIHLAPLLSDSGLTPERAALGVSFMFGISVLARLLAGYMFDRAFAPWVGAVCFFSAALGALLLFGASAPAGFIVAVALLGIGAGAESDLMGYLVSRYFGLKAFGAIFGWIFGALMVGSAIGPFLLGVSYDATGSYSASLLWSVAGLLVTTVMLAILPRFPQFDTNMAPGAEPEPVQPAVAGAV
jgi:MFS family permease